MKKNMIAKAVVLSTSVMASTAFAAGETNTQAKAAFDTLTASATEMSGYAWALVVLIVGAVVGIKLFKKFVNRAS